MRRPAAVLVLSAMVPALLVVPTFGHAAADPHPVAPRLSTVALVGVDAAAFRAEQTHPGPTDAASTRAATDLPEVFTAPTATASYSLVGVTWDGDQPAAVSADDVLVSVRTRTGGDWQAWTTATATVTMPAGTQTLTLYQDNGGWNVNSLTFSAA